MVTMRPQTGLHPSRRGAPQDEGGNGTCGRDTAATCDLAVIPPARRRAASRTAHHERQRETDAAGDQERAERIVAYGLGDRLRSALDAFALINVLGEVAGGFACFARGVLGLAVEGLHGACRLACAAGGLRSCVACEVTRCPFDLAGKILRCACDPILVHRVTP